jgi:hypothetical protein
MLCGLIQGRGNRLRAVFQNLGPLPFQGPPKKFFRKAKIFLENVGDGGGVGWIGGGGRCYFSKTKVPEIFRKTTFFQKFPKFSAKKSFIF